jgi:hypothetical protein
MSAFEKIKVFCGRCFTPRFTNIIAEISLIIEDIDKLRDWALANEGRITLQVSESKSGKVYSEINTFKKNPPANFQQESRAQSGGYNAPLEREQPKYNREPQQESRYGRDDRPAPMLEPPLMPESSQEEDDDIPF